MNPAAAVSIAIGVTGVLIAAAFGIHAILQLNKSEKVTVKGQENVEKAIVAMADAIKADKKWVCQLLIKMRNGQVHSWTNASWDGVAKKFYKWYLGRADSKQYVMRCNGENDKPMTQILLRSEIVYVQTDWIEDPKVKKAKEERRK